MVRKGEGRGEQGCGKAMRKEWDGKNTPAVQGQWGKT